MKKFLLLSATAVAMTANAEVIDKAFFSVPNDNTLAWAVQDAGNVTITTSKDYMEFSHAKNAGRMFNYFWNEEGWTLAPAEFPESTYKVSWDYEMVFNPTDRGDFEMTVIPIDGTTTNAAQGNLATHNYRYLGDAFFRAFISEKADVAGEGGKFTLALNDTPASRNSWDVSTAEAFVTLQNGVMYTFNVDVNVAAHTTTSYVVNKATGERVGMTNAAGEAINETVHQLLEETDTRAGGFALSFQGKGAEGNSVERLGNLKMSYKYDGLIAENPAAVLAFVIREERDYMVKFAEGHVLHWILPGETEEADESGVAYTDATDDEETGDYGNKLIECYQTGTLQFWTSLEDDETIVSDVIKIDVDASLIKMPEPSLTIVNVEEGYKKTYKVNADNSELPLKPTIYLPWTIKDQSGAVVAQGTADNGDEIVMEVPGTFEVYSRDMTRPDGGVWYETSDVVVIANNTEYQLALEKSYRYTFEEAASLPGFHENIVSDNGSSHWDRIYSDEVVNYYDAEGNLDWTKTGFGLYPTTQITDKTASIPTYVVDLDNYKKGFLPLVPGDAEMNESSNYWSIFPLEGIVFYALYKNNNKDDGALPSNHEIGIEERWISDKAENPNIYIVETTNQYDRPDKGNCTSTTVLTVGDSYSLYRYDTAINSVKIYTYKGFTPGESGIQDVQNDAQRVAPIFNLRGEKVQQISAPGFYIQGGKVMVVK